MSGKAFIIGNGQSRKGYDLLELTAYGVIFGCNALYRDYRPIYDAPDFLVAIDPNMITEIESSDFPSERVVIPPMEEQFEPAACNISRPRSNAGCNAILEAIKMGYDEIYILGFDFMIQNEAYTVGNIYDGTNAYGPETRASVVDAHRRLNYIEWIINEHPEVQFTFMFPNLGLTLHSLRVNMNNVRGLLFNPGSPYQSSVLEK